MKQSSKEVKERLKYNSLSIINLGLGSELIPWINNAEKFTTETLEKPRNIVEAQEIEKKCVVFAKVGV